MTHSIGLVDDPRAPTAMDDRPGPGALVAAGERRIVLPLRSVAFKATVVERTAQVTLEQTFANPYADALEAVYIFPLPGDAAVVSFEARIGDTRLVGSVSERGEARVRYEEALRRGARAALLEQERDDVFTVRVGNLAPGAQATIVLTWAERLAALDDGETELRLPLVVAPRYLPGRPLERPSVGDGVTADTDRVPDASRLSPPRLLPGLRADVALSIEVELRGADVVQDLVCTQHAARLDAGPGRVAISLARTDELLDRDFVLRWRVAAQRPRPLLVVARHGAGVHGMLTLVPPRDVARDATARDVTVLLDTSGSMQGGKLRAARDAVLGLLARLGPRDRFRVGAFAAGPRWASPALEPVTPAAIAQARTWLGRLGAEGGTELAAALDEALASETADPARLPALVVITDGEVGNEHEVLRALAERAPRTRVYALGIDTAVHAPFLRRLARIGRGAATLCSPGDSLVPALARVVRDLDAPVLIDIALDDEGLGLEPGTLTPERVPDLALGRTTTVLFRASRQEGALRVRARLAGGDMFDETITAEVIDLPALRSLWARARVSDLEDRFRLAQGDEAEALRRELIDLAVSHQLLTRFTAFAAVEAVEAVAGDQRSLAPRTVVQPVPSPAGWAAEDPDADENFTGWPPRPSRSAMRLTACGAMVGTPIAPNHLDAFPGLDPAAVWARERPRSSWWRELLGLRPGREPELLWRSFPPASFMDLIAGLRELQPDATLDRLEHELSAVLLDLDAGRWPADGGVALELARWVAAMVLAQLHTGRRPQLPHVLELVAHDLHAAVGPVVRKVGMPADHAAALRALKDELVRRRREGLTVHPNPPPPPRRRPQLQAPPRAEKRFWEASV